MLACTRLHTRMQPGMGDAFSNMCEHPPAYFVTKSCVQLLLHVGILSTSERLSVRRVADFCWNANDQWVMASVAEDNVLQVWQVAENIYADDDDDEAAEGEGDAEEAE
eukprot:6190112-Pleurochrysis_carterae.AAC.3